MGIPIDVVFLEVKVPRIKTKSSAKKRFCFTANGYAIAQPACRRHGMRKRSQKMKRQTRGTAVLEACDMKMIHRLMPYS